MSSDSAYERLIRLLDENNAKYRLIDHPPEGRTEFVSPMRGNPVSQAAKCIIVMVKIGKKVTKYILAVVPGDRRADLNKIKSLFNGTYVAFASADIAERLSECVSGTILPISFSSDLELIVDPLVLDNGEIYFNAARLDRSMALNTQDYMLIAKPRMESIADGAKE